MILIENPDELPSFVGRDHATDVNQLFLDSNGRVLFDVHVENLRFKESWMWSKEGNGMGCCSNSALVVGVAFSTAPW